MNYITSAHMTKVLKLCIRSSLINLIYNYGTWPPIYDPFTKKYGHAS